MEKITTGTVSVGREEINNVVTALKNEMLSTGEFLHKFEETFPGFYGKQIGIMVNSGQSAIEVAVEYALQKKYPTIIAVPALTYLSTIWGACRRSKYDLKIVFFDIKLSDYGMDFNNNGFDQFGDSVESEEVNIVIPVDLFGKTCDFAKANDDQIVIEDACESVGNAGCSYGDFICFSFYSSHIMGVGGGGMVTCDDKDAENFIRSYIAHGRSHSGDFTYNTDKFMDRFVFQQYGQSLRSDNIHAAIAIAQYKKVLNFTKARRENAAMISANLKELENIAKLPDMANNVFQFYPLLVDGSDYDVLDLMEFLFRNNIDSRRFMPVLTQPAFKTMFSDIEPEMFPQALLCGEKGILLGCHQNLTLDQIDYMCEKVLEFFRIRRDI